MDPIFFRVRLMGTIAGGEVWSCSLGYALAIQAPTQGDVYDYLKQWADNITSATPAEVFPTALTNLLSRAANIQKVRIEAYGTGAVLITAAESQWTPAITTAAAPVMPAQSAITISLNTGRPGRSYAGRIYWPCLAATISDTTMRLTAAQTVAIASAAGVMVQKIRDLILPLGPVLPVVVSLTKSEYTRIESVRVGDVIDTQRRRRDGYAERYSIVNLA